ncbi:F0F1 ATP synthase subunit delta [Paenibacillus sp. FSL H8-0537]|uniref:F0F1 ATP synthase subunit delta n=1 Tax=Paenibacillus sp. FSL H8-0537 TaxID=2921399 RepID=UPI0031015CFF
MSRDAAVAKRYAKALFELAQQGGIISEVEQQLQAIAQSLGEDLEIQKFLSYPNIDASKKLAVLKAAFGGSISELLLNTLELVFVRGRQELIVEIYEAFTKIAGEVLKQAHATVYTARLLNDAELAEVAVQFGGLTGKTIIAEQVVEPALLGGVKVRIGDRLYDGSLSGKLERLEKQLKSKAL